IPAELERVLEEMAKEGVPYYTWAGLRELLEAKLVAVIDGFNASFGYEEDKGGRPFTQRKTDLVEALRSFDGAPFTLQRLAEVLLEPERQYQATHKLLNSLDKVLSVSSTLP
ncbi:protein phosphatase 4 core regulatory subunit R2, partial [Tribonema minus]